MFNQEEKTLLLSLLSSLRVSGTRAQIKATMEKLDVLERKIQEMPVEEVQVPEEPKATEEK